MFERRYTFEFIQQDPKSLMTQNDLKLYISYSYLVVLLNDPCTLMQL